MIPHHFVPIAPLCFLWRESFFEVPQGQKGSSSKSPALSPASKSLECLRRNGCSKRKPKQDRIRFWKHFSLYPTRVFLGSQHFWAAATYLYNLYIVNNTLSYRLGILKALVTKNNQNTEKQRTSPLGPWRAPKWASGCLSSSWNGFWKLWIGDSQFFGFFWTIRTTNKIRVLAPIRLLCWVRELAGSWRKSPAAAVFCMAWF